jgi:nucleoside-diphosphate-sugar epimerase
MAQKVFITGATGFLGLRLLAELLRQTDCRFILLVRSPCAQAIVGKHFGPSDLSRLRFVRGDVTLPGLGLDADTRATLAATVSEVWHLAASTSFEESKRADTFRTNVEGTRHLLEVVASFRRLGIVYHVSTAYVCGKRLGRIPEGPFAVPEGFKNPYEESKHEAESLVRASGLPAAIIRPSILMGDSRTGDNGGDLRVYYGYTFALVRALMHAFGSATEYWNYWRDAHGNARQPARNVNARLVGHAETQKNILTVDDVVAVCLAIRTAGAAIGRTFNLVNPRNIALGDALKVIQRVLKVSGFSYDRYLSRTVLSDDIVERAAFRYTRMYWPYGLNTEPHWETRNVDQLSVGRVLMSEQVFESLILSFVRDLAAPSVPIIGETTASFYWHGGP